MAIAPLVNPKVSMRIHAGLLDAMEHYLSLSRAGHLFASIDYYEHAESAAWVRLMEAVAMADAVAPATGEESPPAWA
jgi:hypothetical protein